MSERIDPVAAAKRISVPLYSDILAKIKSRYPKARNLNPVDREIARLQVVYNILMDKTSFVRDLVKLLDSLHPFYWRLIEIEFDRQDIHKAIKCVSRARKISTDLWNKYRYLILASESRGELKRVSTEARGRIMSSIKKCSRGLGLLRDLVIFLQHLPYIDPFLDTVIIAGPPSSGKSTLVRSVSNAKPKVSPYPFTTKTIHIGHYTIGDQKIQVIDTPGILDRDPSEMNQVEKRAAAALTELDGVIVFLLDPSSDAYMELEQQISLAKRIRSLVPNKPMIAFINKIDVAEPSLLDKARRLSQEAAKTGVFDGIMEGVASEPASARKIIEAAVAMKTRGV